MKRQPESIFYDHYMSKESHDFIEASKLSRDNFIDFSQNLQSLMANPYVMRPILEHREDFFNKDLIALHPSKKQSPLKDLQAKRKSSRQYSEKAMDFQAFSNVLTHAYFISEEESLSPDLPSLKRRNIASGGGLYPIDIYVIAMNIETLKPGVYKYDIHSESIIQKRVFQHPEDSENIREAFFSSIRNDIDFTNAAGIILFSAVMNRVSFKYGDRGTRFAMFDCGALTHAMYLAAAEENISCCASAAYLDDELAKEIGINSRNETILNAMIIGEKG